MARKTVDVQYIRDTVNTALTVPNSSLYMKAPGKDRDLTVEEAFRMGIISLLENVLHYTDNYHGFGYQDGIVTYPDNGDPGDITFGDESRRVYY